MKRHDWEAQADNWISWISRGRPDAFDTYAPAFFHDFVPPIGGHVLDLGCGEGRSTRMLTEARRRIPSPGRHVTVGVDSSHTLIRAAAREAGDPGYVQTDAAALPFADGTFDLVVAYNALMDLDEPAASLVEIARVLTNRGRLAACVLHPLAEAGAFESRDRDARFVIDRSYFDEGPYRRTLSREGQALTFSSNRYTLGSYAGMMRQAGLAIEDIREPRPDARTIALDPSEERWARIPLFMFLLAMKAGD